jgi:hypothetical protein
VAADMALVDLLATIPPGHRPQPWSWEDEERDIWSRLCLCCGQPGHYQETVEARIAAHGFTEGVCIGEDGRLHDGHHRVVAASALGIERVPLETKDEADSRWLRDHGTFVWELRRFGDVHPGEAWSWVQNFCQAARDFAAHVVALSTPAAPDPSEGVLSEPEETLRETSRPGGLRPEYLSGSESSSAAPDPPSAGVEYPVHSVSWMARYGDAYPPEVNEHIIALEAELARERERGERLAGHVERITSMPTSERNPDGDEQAAHSMLLVAEEALAAYREASGTVTLDPSERSDEDVNPRNAFFPEDSGTSPWREGWLPPATVEQVREALQKIVDVRDAEAADIYFGEDEGMHVGMMAYKRNKLDGLDTAADIALAALALLPDAGGES